MTDIMFGSVNIVARAARVLMLLAMLISAAIGPSQAHAASLDHSHPVTVSHMHVPGQNGSLAGHHHGGVHDHVPETTEARVSSASACCMTRVDWTRSSDAVAARNRHAVPEQPPKLIS